MSADGPEQRTADLESRLTRDDERQLIAAKRADEDARDATDAYTRYWLNRVLQP